MNGKWKVWKDGSALYYFTTMLNNAACNELLIRAAMFRWCSIILDVSRHLNKKKIPFLLYNMCDWDPRRRGARRESGSAH